MKNKNQRGNWSVTNSSIDKTKYWRCLTGADPGSAKAGPWRESWSWRESPWTPAGSRESPSWERSGRRWSWKAFVHFHTKEGLKVKKDLPVSDRSPPCLRQTLLAAMTSPNFWSMGGGVADQPMPGSTAAVLHWLEIRVNTDWPSLEVLRAEHHFVEISRQTVKCHRVAVMPTHHHHHHHHHLLKTFSSPSAAGRPSHGEQSRTKPTYVKSPVSQWAVNHIMVKDQKVVYSH